MGCAPELCVDAKKGQERYRQLEQIALHWSYRTSAAHFKRKVQRFSHLLSELRQELADGPCFLPNGIKGYRRPQPLIALQSEVPTWTGVRRDVRRSGRQTTCGPNHLVCPNHSCSSRPSDDRLRDAIVVKYEIAVPDFRN